MSDRPGVHVTQQEGNGTGGAPGDPIWDPPSAPAEPSTEVPTSAQEAPSPTKSTQSESGGPRKALATLTAVLVVGLLGAIGYVVLSGGDEVADPEPPDASQPAPAGPNATGPETAGPETAGPETTGPEDAEVEGDDTSGLTDVQKRIAADARTRITGFPRSRAVLIEALTNSPDEPVSVSDATVAVDSLGIDWNLQARLTADIAIENSAYSRPLLQSHLTSEPVGFTEDQATQAVEALDVDWTAQPERYATDFADDVGVSRKVLLQAMIDSALFEEAEATKGIDDANIDFNAEAAQAADELLELTGDLPCDEVIARLSDNTGFTPEQAAYGAGTTDAC